MARYERPLMASYPVMFSDGPEGRETAEIINIDYRMENKGIES
jgi:hypothetical protein